MEGQYIEVRPGDVPDDLVWMVPGRGTGQATEEAYSRGIRAGKLVDYSAAHGDPWMRSTGSDRRVTYYLWVADDELAILVKAALGSQRGSSTYQPPEESLHLAKTMLRNGLLEREDGFSTLRPSSLGWVLYRNQ